MGTRNTPEQSRRYAAEAAERQRKAGRKRWARWVTDAEAKAELEPAYQRVLKARKATGAVD